MKRIYFIIAMFALFAGNAWTQKYHPFVEEGKEWVIYNDYYMDDYETPLEEREPYRTYTITGDTIIQGKSYKKLYAMCERVFGDKDVHYFCALREEERKVYRVSAGCEDEKMLYDFAQGTGEENSFTYYIEGILFPEMDGRVIRMRIDETYVVDERLIRHGATCYDDVPEKNWNSYVFYTIEGCGEIIDPFLTELWSPNIYIIDFENRNRIFVKDSQGTYDANFSKYVDFDGIETHESFLSDNTCGNRLLDLQGRRLTIEPQRGVFIKGGKKVMK